MLINCPRCGFSQPNDQYCAQCGVDMQTFKPKQKPFLQGLVESAIFQVIVLLLAVGFVGQRIMRGSATELLGGQRTIHSQGFTRSEKRNNPGNTANTDSESAFASSSGEGTGLSSETDQSLAKNEKETATSARDKSTGNSLAAAGGGLGEPADARGAEAGVMHFKLTYAEVANDVVSKWIVDSSNLGLYQSLPEYSVGILYDFKKRGESFKQSLKTADIKVALGASASNLSGIMTDDGSQLIGLAASVELKSGEAEALHGSIIVTKNSRQGTETFPSEFELPKGSAFFILGALKTENFSSERTKLQMPPFQIFKSPEFMTHKAEFVIILEPDYK